jgi:selenide,water dikinase
MVDDPELFGQIVVYHVLSDLYAVRAKPRFALNILGVPLQEGEVSEESTRSIDADITLMLSAAHDALAAEGVLGAGGHTLMDHALFFGMAATGEFSEVEPVSNAGAEPGDALVLTKRIGTSVATKLWRTEPERKGEFSDVLEGMLRSNRAAAEVMSGLDRCACTDVTGFGFLGHLHNMLNASGMSARIDVSEVPVYESVRSLETEVDTRTRIFEPNRRFFGKKIENNAGLSEDQLAVHLDAQVSGGLLISMATGAVDAFRREMSRRGEAAWVVGEVSAGDPGAIELA